MSVQAFLTSQCFSKRFCHRMLANVWRGGKKVETKPRKKQDLFESRFPFLLLAKAVATSLLWNRKPRFKNWRLIWQGGRIYAGQIGRPDWKIIYQTLLSSRHVIIFQLERAKEKEREKGKREGESRVGASSSLYKNMFELEVVFRMSN